MRQGREEVLRTGRNLPPEKTLGTHCTGGWVDLRAGLDTEARGKSFASAGDRTPVVQPVVRHYTDWATPALHSVQVLHVTEMTLSLKMETVYSSETLVCTYKPIRRYSLEDEHQHLN
jgi:hypothetical protein